MLLSLVIFILHLNPFSPTSFSHSLPILVLLFTVKFFGIKNVFLKNIWEILLELNEGLLKNIWEKQNCRIWWKPLKYQSLWLQKLVEFLVNNFWTAVLLTPIQITRNQEIRYQVKKWCAQRRVTRFSRILNNLNKNLQSMRKRECQLNENPEAEQKEAKEKVRLCSVRGVDSKCLVTRQNVFPGGFRWLTRYSIKNLNSKAPTSQAAKKQNSIVSHVQFTAE